jgi:hemerythrin-like domain-containing protein
MGDYSTRRRFVSGAGLASFGALMPSASAQHQRPGTQGKAEKAEEVSPTEDLMREHGVLNRVLLIYDEVLRRLRGNEQVDAKVLSDAAGIIRRFIEQYHEKLEEDYLFPRFEKANRLTDLVKTLRSQHAAGRNVTSNILQLATPAGFKNADQKRRLQDALRAFTRLYRPHEAREDTVLFPAFHDLVSQHEFDALGEEFEKKEHQLFGADGFQTMVDRVAGLEKALGIYDLSQFTPR